MQFGTEVETGAGAGALVPVQVEEAEIVGNGAAHLLRPRQGAIHVTDDEVGLMGAQPIGEIGFGDGLGFQDRNVTDAALVLLKRTKGGRPFVHDAVVFVVFDEEADLSVAAGAQALERIDDREMVVERNGVVGDLLGAVVDLERGKLIPGKTGCGVVGVGLEKNDAQNAAGAEDAGECDR
ncbi:MAG: hypothetical protein CFE26_24945, partial [Verrucomicrobiales bacterium VVV1]